MTLRVSLAQRERSASTSDLPELPPRPLLDPRGARVVLGTRAAGDAVIVPIRPAADTLFGPRGACLIHRGGPLIVCDTGHHRLLVWSQEPTADQVPADLVIGQPDFGTEGRNARGAVGPATFNVPTAIAFGDGVQEIADAWNHRVLLWHGVPTAANRPADVVLGQADFQSGDANRGSKAPQADTLNWCYGVLIHEGRLLVADTGNRRVLMWETIPASNGAPADLVLGQLDLTTRDASSSLGSGAVGMRWPHGITVAGKMLLVTDAGSNRVMVWRDLPHQNGMPCDLVLGQADFAALDQNRSAYHPSAAALNMPHGLAVQDDCLICADTANSRLLGFELDRLAMGAAAHRLAGQSTFAGKGENRWHAAARDSVCWPYGVAVSDHTVSIADSGNNRVLLWDMA